MSPNKNIDNACTLVPGALLESGREPGAANAPRPTGFSRLVVCATGLVGWVAVVGTLLGAASLSAQTAEAGTSSPPAHGLIVKLKDAPPHAAALERRQDNGRPRGDVERERLQRVMAQAGVAALKTRPSGRASQMVDFGRVLSGREAETLAAQLRQRPEVEWVVPNERERRLQVATSPAPVSPNDPLFAASNVNSGQWWLYANGSANSQATPGFQSVWSRGYLGSTAPVVAVLDTGITSHPDLTRHPALNAQALPGYDFVEDSVYDGDGMPGRDADPSDPGDFVSRADKTGPNAGAFDTCDERPSSWHGTAITGMLAAITDNGVGVAGISWNGRVLPVRVAGKCGAAVADIVDGMRWAAGLEVFDSQNRPIPLNPHKARVVNISFGGSEACNDAYRAAIADLAEVGVVVVAAAGNDSGGISRPASCSGVVAVAALNRDGMKASYSNFGSAVTISTVGGDIGSNLTRASYDDGGLLSLHNDGATTVGNASYSYLEGTSFAAPIVAGTVSLMLSVNPNLTLAQIIDGLTSTARPHIASSTIGTCSSANPARCACATRSCGAGILDAEQAVLYATSPRADAGAGDSGSGGGGALGWGWLLALGVAVGALAKHRVTR